MQSHAGMQYWLGGSLRRGIYAFLLLAVVCVVGCDPSTKCTTDEECDVGTFCQVVEGTCGVACKSDRDCKAGQQCDTTRGKCKEKGVVCQPKEKKQCVGSQLYFFDSCGYQGEVAEDCGLAGCSDDKCSAQDPCGNGTCEPGKEDCLSCPADCGCKTEETCDNGTCKPADTCGNGTCDAGKETCTSCPKDCACKSGQLCDSGSCQEQASCGNGTCEADQKETCVSCPADCPCSAGQSCVSSSGTCVDACGDGKCDAKSGENCSTCAKDCTCGSSLRCLQGRCERPCGNGRCESSYGENCGTCSQDCPCPQGKACKDGQCGEDCGNGTCDAAKGEDCSNCPKDCTCQADQSCESGQCKSWCGNGACDKDKNENCETCAKDCGCPTGTSKCEGGQCKALCGDGQCKSGDGEDCESCPVDCKCPTGKKCINKACGCVADCSGKTCGDDGCGGSCGSCTGRTRCNNGVCECRHDCKAGESTCIGSGSYERCEQDADGCRYLKTNNCQSGAVCQAGSCCGSSCTGKECGPDGCGGDCGTCSTRASCQAGKCLCKNECKENEFQCIGTTGYKECLKDAGNCLYWSANKTCGGGQKCTAGKCCTPICSGKECGSNGCGADCGTCAYGCGAGLCRRELLALTVRIHCDQCNDIFGNKADPYIKLTLSTGASFKSSEKGNSCNTVTFNWTVKNLDPLGLRNAKLEVWDSDSTSADDLCGAWSGDFSKPGRFTFTDSGRRSAQITIEVKK